MSFDLGVWYSDLAISDKEAHKIYRRLGRDPHVLKGNSAGCAWKRRSNDGHSLLLLGGVEAAEKFKKVLLVLWNSCVPDSPVLELPPAKPAKPKNI